MLKFPWGYLPKQAIGGFPVALTDTVIRKAKIATTAHRLSDGGGLYLTFFAVMKLVQFLVVLLVYPETKGQTLEPLQRKLVPAQ